MTEVTSKRPLTQLNHDIEEAEAESARLESERKIVSKDTKRARWANALFANGPIDAQANRVVRNVAHDCALGPDKGAIGVLTFIVVHLIFNSFAIAFIGLLAGVAGGAALLAALLYRPPDSLLPTAIAEAESHTKLADARLKEKVERITETKQRLQRLVDERRDQIASGKLQKAALLQRNWKAMREAEWQDFVVEVCRTLGAKVERVGHSNEEANLIADFGSRRIAVLTHGEGHHVSSASIQLAIAARERHRSDSCAVIINRRFTGAAQDFAERNNCTAIGTGEFPDFVMGKVEI